MRSFLFAGDPKVKNSYFTLTERGPDFEYIHKHKEIVLYRRVESEPLCQKGKTVSVSGSNVRIGDANQPLIADADNTICDVATDGKMLERTLYATHVRVGDKRFVNRKVYMRKLHSEQIRAMSWHEYIPYTVSQLTVYGEKVAGRADRCRTMREALVRAMYYGFDDDFKRVQKKEGPLQWGEQPFAILSDTTLIVPERETDFYVIRVSNHEFPFSPVFVVKDRKLHWLLNRELLKTDKVQIVTKPA